MVGPKTTGQSDELSTKIFLAMSKRQRSPLAREATMRAAAVVREACQQATRLDPDVTRRVEVTESCLVPTEVAPVKSRSTRRKLANEVDAVVGLLGDASFDCGREIGWAVEFGIPTLLVHPRASTPPLHVGGTPLEACAVRDYGSLSELSSVVNEWMDLNSAAILAGPMRRSRPLSRTERLRGATRARWTDAVPEERRRVSDAVQAPEVQLDAVLADGSDFAAARSGLTLDVAQELGVEMSVGGFSSRDWLRRAEVPVLPDDARRGLQDAIDTWGWDGSTTRRAIELGLRKLRHDREVIMTGSLQRTSSLSNRFAWKRLLDRDAH
jgi:hypothetical protein